MRACAPACSNASSASRARAAARSIHAPCRSAVRNGTSIRCGGRAHRTATGYVQRRWGWESRRVPTRTRTPPRRCSRPGPDQLAWLCRRKKYRVRGTHRLWIHRAPEASDIRWENLGVNGGAARTRRFLSWVFMTVLMVCTCAMVVLAESAQSTVPPAIACDSPEEEGTLVGDAIWPAAA